jgi:hypothetical protein
MRRPHLRLLLSALLVAATAAGAAPATDAAGPAGAPGPDASVPVSSTGSAAGRYQVLSPRSIALEGRVRDASGRTRHRMQAALIGGEEEGQLHGRWVEVLPGDGRGEDLLRLEFDLVGQYARASDGRLRFVAQVYLDLTRIGLPVYVLVGDLRGGLERAPGGGERGEFRARYALR